MSRRSTARRIALTATATAALMFAAVGGAKAQCEGFDCGGGEVVSGPKVRYTFPTFRICTDCPTSQGGRATAFIEGVRHPPNPAHPPHPVRPLAQGKLLVSGARGADAIHAIGRIYSLGREYLFDGHLVPGTQQPPSLPPSFIFQGIIFEGGMSDSRRAPQGRSGVHERRNGDKRHRRTQGQPTTPLYSATAAAQQAAAAEAAPAIDPGQGASTSRTGCHSSVVLPRSSQVNRINQPCESTSRVNHLGTSASTQHACVT